MAPLIYPIEEPVGVAYPDSTVEAARAARPDATVIGPTWRARNRRIPPRLACDGNADNRRRCQEHRAARVHSGKCGAEALAAQAHLAEADRCAQCRAGPGGFYRCAMGCEITAYMYPRHIRYEQPRNAPLYSATHSDYVKRDLIRSDPEDAVAGEVAAWHYHEGVDLGGREGWDRIVSVSSGTVREVVTTYGGPRAPNPFRGYGKCVLVEAPNGLFYFYAHCDDVLVAQNDTVQVGTPLGIVGRTQFDSVEYGRFNPHLHFEVRTRARPSRSLGCYGEHNVDYPEGERNTIDPRAHLEGEGTAPPSFYFPVTRAVERPPATEDHPDPENPEYAVSDALAARLHQEVEQANGGQFPVGTDNFWHGGVHLEASSVVRAPFDGEVVAVRLDPQAEVEGLDGSANFILLKHTIPSDRLRSLQRGGSRASTASTDPWARHTVGAPLPPRRARSPRLHNQPPDLVLRVRTRLHEVLVDGAPLYAPSEPGRLTRDTVDRDDAELEQAIRRLQERMGMTTPDGAITYEGRTWVYLEQQAAIGRGETPPPPPPPPPANDTVYSLIMHLPPRAIDAELVRQVPWLGRVALPPTDEERTEAERAQRAAADQLARDERAPEDRPSDTPDRSYTLTDSVGHAAGTPNDYTADVRWVQRRLTVHGVSITEDGRPSQALRDGIEAFQRSFRTIWDRIPEAERRGGRPNNRTTGRHRVDGLVAHPPGFYDRPTPSHPVPSTYHALRMSPDELRAWFSRGESNPAPDPGAVEITGSVGFARTSAVNAEADVRWVQRRLRIHGHTEVRVSGEFDAATEAAIVAFQGGGDGVVSVPTRRSGATSTFNQLRQTEAERAGSASEEPWRRLVSRAGVRTRSVVPPVADVVRLGGVQVQAGEALWLVEPPARPAAGDGGDAPAAAPPPVPTLHWELFSTGEQPLVAAWAREPDAGTAAADRDLDRDLTIEVPSLIRQVEASSAEQDQRLSADEISAFYASPAAEPLRRTQYRFCSEWGLDLAAAERQADDLGFRLGPSFWQPVAGYQWWGELNSGADAPLPESPVVWHYNPIEFLQHYQTLLAP